MTREISVVTQVKLIESQKMFCHMADIAGINPFSLILATSTRYSVSSHPETREASARPAIFKLRDKRSARRNIGGITRRLLSIQSSNGWLSRGQPSRVMFLRPVQQFGNIPNETVWLDK